MKISANDVQKVLDIITAFSTDNNYYNLLDVILKKMMELTNADGGTLYVIEEGKLHFRIMITLSMGIYKRATEKIGIPPILLDENNIENVSAYAALKNEIISIRDVYCDKRFNFSGPKKFDETTGYHTGSMLVFPLTSTSGGEILDVIGVIQLINATDKDSGEIISFEEACDISLLRALSNISMNALANITYAKEVEDLFRSFVMVMTKAIDERSVYNVSHTYTMAEYCDSFIGYLDERFPKGHKYYFGENRREQIVMAAYLHDIGKIITPLDIMDKADRLGSKYSEIKFRFGLKKYQLENSFLRGEMSKEQFETATEEAERAFEFISDINKAGFLTDEKLAAVEKLASLSYVDLDGNTVPILSDLDIDALMIRKGTLTAAERKIMQEHASITGRLLDNMKFNKRYRNVARWARSHHETLDGKGYPAGLSGDEIDIEICILTICDIFEALMANDRPYRKAMPEEKALSILLSMVEEGKLHKELTELFAESRVWRKE